MTTKQRQQQQQQQHDYVKKKKEEDGSGKKMETDAEDPRGVKLKQQWDEELGKRRLGFTTRMDKDFPQHARQARKTVNERKDAETPLSILPTSPPTEEARTAKAFVREHLTFSMSSLPMPASVLSTGLTLPFLVSPAFYAMESMDPEFLITLQLNYSALMLVLFGAMHVGMAMTGHGKWSVVKGSPQNADKSEERTMDKKLDDIAARLRGAAETGSNRQWTNAVDSLPTGISSPYGWSRMMYGVMSIFFALMSLSLPAFQAVILLSASHLALLLFDLIATKQGLAPWWFMAFKTPIVIVSILITVLSLLFYMVYGTMHRLREERKAMQKEADDLLNSKSASQGARRDQPQEPPPLSHMIRRRPGMTVVKSDVVEHDESQ